MVRVAVLSDSLDSVERQMNRELRGIQDWVERARKARYGVKALAKNCGCSVRQLERHFARGACPPPEAWLRQLKLWDAVQFMIEGQAIKQASASAGFAHLGYFYQTFRSFHRCTPLQFLGDYEDRHIAHALEMLNLQPSLGRPAPENVA